MREYNAAAYRYLCEVTYFWYISVHDVSRWLNPLRLYEMRGFSVELRKHLVALQKHQHLHIIPS